MFSILLLIVFFLGIGFLGWQIARSVLKIGSIELLLPLSLAIGYGVYTFFLNLLSYFISIEFNFYFLFSLLLVGAFGLFFLDKKRPDLKYGLNKKETVMIFLTALAIMISSGLVVSREIQTDDLAYNRLPVAASMVGGNFPAKELNIPSNDLLTHYGSSLFYAAISKITGFSILFGFRISVFLFSAVIFLLLFNVARLFVGNNFSSFLVGLVGMFGGGFRFIYGFEGALTLYRKFVLHWDIPHPFKFLAGIWDINPLTGPLIGNIFFTWAAVGWSLVLAIIYLYLVYVVKKEKSYAVDLLMVVLLSVLALNVEIGFAMICLGMLVSPFIFYLKSKNKNSLKILLGHSLLILVLTACLVSIQGGTATVLLKNIIQNKPSYGSNVHFFVFKTFPSFFTGIGWAPFYGLTFVLNFGLAYFLIIPAIIFTAKKHFKKTIFLAVVSCFSFVMPLCVSFDRPWQDTMNRFFRFSGFIWAILVGLFLVLVLTWLKNRRLLKKIIYIGLVIICLDGIVFLLTRPLYKRQEYRLNNNSFFVYFRPLTKVEASAYAWTRQNSGIKDYFLVFCDEKDINKTSGIFQNFRFVMFSHRLAPIYSLNHNYFEASYYQNDSYYAPFYKRLINDCNKDDMQKLNYRYLLVDNNWPEGLEKKCLANNDLELKFSQKQDGEFVRIYSVK